MLNFFATKSAVGLYSAAYSILDYLMISSNSMMGAVFPNFTALATEDPAGLKRLYKKMYVLFSVLLIPIALLLMIGAPYILQLLFGAEFTEAANALRFLMIAAVFAWANGPSGTIFIALDKQHIYFVATLAGLLANVVGNLFLIPILGISGAAISTVLTELSLCIISFLYLYRLIGYIPFVNSLPKEASQVGG